MHLLGKFGLTGEIRTVNLIDKRLKEVEKLGFKTCFIPENNKKLLKDTYKLDIIGLKNINDAMKKLGLKWVFKNRLEWNSLSLKKYDVIIEVLKLISNG